MNKLGRETELCMTLLDFKGVVQDWQAKELHCRLCLGVKS